MFPEAAHIHGLVLHTSLHYCDVDAATVSLPVVPLSDSLPITSRGKRGGVHGDFWHKGRQAVAWSQTTARPGQQDAYGLTQPALSVHPADTRRHYRAPLRKKPISPAVVQPDGNVPWIRRVVPHLQAGASLQGGRKQQGKQYVGSAVDRASLPQRLVITSRGLGLVRRGPTGV